MAASCSTLAIVTMLVNKGADVDAKDEVENIPVHQHIGYTIMPDHPIYLSCSLLRMRFKSRPPCVLEM